MCDYANVLFWLKLPGSSGERHQVAEVINQGEDQVAHCICVLKEDRSSESAAGSSAGLQGSSTDMTFISLLLLFVSKTEQRVQHNRDVPVLLQVSVSEESKRSVQLP